MEKFNFNLCIYEGKLLQEGIFAKYVPNCGLVSIKSNNFDDLEECEKTALNLLRKFKTHLALIEGFTSSILVRKNPEYYDIEDTSDSTTEWESDQLMKMYVVSPFELQSGFAENYQLVLVIKSTI